MKLRRKVLLWLLAGICGVIAFQKYLQQVSGAELAELLPTSKHGIVTLQHPWVGQYTAVSRTENWPIPSGPNRREGGSLFFDKFSYWEKTANWNPGQKTLGESVGEFGVTSLHVYRPSLPPDSVILAAKTEADLVELFGRAQNPSDGWGDGEMNHGSAGWSFFALSDPLQIQTLSVHCLLKRRVGNSTGEWQVEGVEIYRGSATPMR